MRRRAALLLACAVLAVVAVGWMPRSHHHPLDGPTIQSLILRLILTLLPFACGLVWALNGLRSRRAGRVRGDARGLFLDDRLVLARRRMQAAAPLTHGQALRIWRSWGGPVDVELASQEDAQALAHALGLGAGESVASFRATLVLRSNYLLVFGPAAALPLFFLVGRHLPMVAFSVFAVMFLAALLGHAKVRLRVFVGSDGILLRRALGRARFVSYESIAAAHGKGRLIDITLRSDEVITLSVENTPNVRNIADSHEALLRRIEVERAAHAARSDSHSDEALLSPGGRPIETWLRDVRTLASTEQYRAPTLDAGRLLQVATDPSAMAATRAGAALALAGGLGDDDRARLRLASEACADPHLRLALTRVAEGASRDAIDEAVTAVAEGEHTATRA